ncbi:Arrestin domain-containing protein 2 [Linnemannia gamsii]|uniref:Arrestin domain-containing protein 2 n=1 Tax=Linnemannia gamsii TaxID=64522 RepID=A0ABQ7K6E0_9FUNG|nr:Arrestin domain-containing protein 2 [Linnemannia gamsii]
MKKLSIDLDEDAIKATPFRPGDTLTGRVNFHTSASLRYTCIKVRFVGLVSTKVAKSVEEVYVLNQQTVLLGNPNNATISDLDEGKHSWPFHFTVPLQHLPSSGKYRHGTVKYTLTAVVTCTKFLGGIQDINKHKEIDFVDHDHDSNYSNAVSIVGSSNTKLYTNNDRHLATATVSIARSAYRPGQVLTLSVDLAHPQKIRRDPGCWIQLIRKESYSAKEQIREYSHVIAASAHAIKIESGSNTGKILAEITLPVDANPTMDTTKIISIQYHILFLFDMRSQTGFFERKSKKTVNQKLRKKILESPGGFEIDLPIIMDIVAEARPPLEISLEYQTLIAEEARGRDSFYGNPYDSIVISTNQLSIAQPGPVQDYFSSPVLSASGSPSLFPASSLSPSLYPISSPSQSSFPVSSPSIPSPAVTRIQDPFSASSKATYVPQTKYVRTVPPRYSTLLPSFKPRGGGSESSQGSSSFSGAPSTRSHTLPILLPYSSSSSPSSTFRTSANPITDNDLFFKPLPTIPQPADNSLSPSMSTVQRQQQAPSSSYNSFRSTEESSSTANDSRVPGLLSTLNKNPRSPLPAHTSHAGTSSSSSYGYYPEKSAPLPDDSLYFSNPAAVGVQQNATAPNAVDLGVGPMSPPTSFTFISPPSAASPAPSFTNISSSASTLTAGHDYRTYVSLPLQQATAGYQSIPPQPTLYRYNPMASASAPRLYSPDFSQAAEPVPAIPSSASSIPSIPSMPPRPPADAGQSDQFHLYKLTDHSSPQTVPPYMH